MNSLISGILAFVLLCSPIIFGLFIINLKFFSLPSVILAVFLFHILVLPLQFILNSRNNWDKDFLNATFFSWLHPRILKHVSLALIYPYIFGLYYSIIRYSRLGSYVFLDISKVAPYQYFILLFFLTFSFLFILLLPFIEKFFMVLSSFRNYLWEQTTDLFYSFYIYLLSKNYIFKFLEKAYKSYYFLAFFIGVKNITYFLSSTKLPWYRYVFSYLFYNFLNIIVISTFLSIFLEIVFTRGHIYYGLYLLFFMPFVRFFFYLWQSLCLTPFYRDVCLADYLYTSWDELKDPQSFPIFVESAHVFFPIVVDLKPSQVIKLKEIEKKFNVRSWEFRRKTIPVRHRSQLVERVRNHPWGFRFAANYYDTHNKRFYHSSPVLHTIPKTIAPWKSIPPLEKNLHSGVAALCQSPMQKAAIFNANYLLYDFILRMEKRTGGFSLHKETFISGVAPPRVNEKSFTIHTEEAARSFFYPIQASFGIVPSRFSRSMPVSYVEKTQQAPDVLLDGRNSITSDKRIHSYDLKAGKVTRTNNIVSTCQDETSYKTLIGWHKKYMGILGTDPKIESVLSELTHNYGDIPEQQNILFANSHLFSGLHMPPLPCPNHFYTGWFSIKGQNAYCKAQDILYQVDFYLKSRNIKEPKTNAEWDFFHQHIVPAAKRDLAKILLNDTWSTQDTF